MKRGLQSFSKFLDHKVGTVCLSVCLSVCWQRLFGLRRDMFIRFTTRWGMPFYASGGIANAQQGRRSKATCGEKGSYGCFHQHCQLQNDLGKPGCLRGARCFNTLFRGTPLSKCPQTHCLNVFCSLKRLYIGQVTASLIFERDGTLLEFIGDEVCCEFTNIGRDYHCQSGIFIPHMHCFGAPVMTQ